MEPVIHKHTPYSLQPPCGLPSHPSHALSIKSTTQIATPLSSFDSRTNRQEYRELTLDFDLGYDEYPSDEEGETLMSCFGTLSIHSPLIPFKKAQVEVDDHAHEPDNESEKKRTDLSDTQRRSVLTYAGPKMSDRATQGPDAGPLIDRFSCLFQDQYDSATNPKGIVSLGVAENYLMQAECIKLFENSLQSNFTLLDLSYGDSLWGSRRITKALSGFYNDWFNPLQEVKPEHIITGVGCSAVLDQLFYTLMDEGEAILLAAPYRVRLVPVHIPLDECFEPGSLRWFEKRYEELIDLRIKVRAVIVCNPQNPLGRTYPRTTLLAYAKFCEERDLHLVSDEIYAMSVYENTSFKDALPFTSMMSLDIEKEIGIRFDKARLHIVYGMSKDFCANGLRVGSLVSQSNPFLIRVMSNTSMLMKLSSPADIIWSNLLQNKVALTKFITTNCQRLAEAQAFTRKWFEGRGVQVGDSNAGNFIFINLGKSMGFHDAKSEKRLFQKLLDGGVYVAPGSAYHYNVAGWYRVTFSVARDNLLVGLDRIEQLLNLRRPNFSKSIEYSI
ncbi:uncharacterized protein L203_102505 [Cryptococcus depauperatus CBS 7841]|uniref:Aminotransferase class I/classII large domain-containing protein n=1 Tax=Cryptococcus depauperatus CBS 7841 TaxID=1295531 RepID=A0AAJ8JS10_9TREE